MLPRRKRRGYTKAVRNPIAALLDHPAQNLAGSLVDEYQVCSPDRQIKFNGCSCRQMSKRNPLVTTAFGNDRVKNSIVKLRRAHKDRRIVIRKRERRRDAGLR